jgi:hypothetical protein
VQQCGACNTQIVLQLDVEDSTASMRKLASFFTWLPKHASLVRTMMVSVPTVQGRPMHIEASQLMLSLLQPALQLAAVHSLASAAAGQYASVMPLAAGGAAAGTAAQSAAALAARSATGHSLLPLQQQDQQQQMSPGLRLERFVSRVLGAAGLLAVLPAHSFCSLELAVALDSFVNGPAMFASLARLSSLQQLQLTCHLFGPQGDALSCVTALQSLSQLTELKLGGYWPGATAEASFKSLQQLLAQPLALRMLRLSAYTGVRTHLPVLEMRQLTQLTNLSIKSQLPEGSAAAAVA